MYEFSIWLHDVDFSDRRTVQESQHRHQTSHLSVKMASQNGNREEFVEGWTLAQTLGEGAYGE